MQSAGSKQAQSCSLQQAVSLSLTLCSLYFYLSFPKVPAHSKFTLPRVQIKHTEREITHLHARARTHITTKMQFESPQTEQAANGMYSRIKI